MSLVLDQADAREFAQDSRSQDAPFTEDASSVSGESHSRNPLSPGDADSCTYAVSDAPSVGKYNEDEDEGRCCFRWCRWYWWLLLGVAVVLVAAGVTLGIVLPMALTRGNNVVSFTRDNEVGPTGDYGGLQAGAPQNKFSMTPATDFSMSELDLSDNPIPMNEDGSGGVGTAYMLGPGQGWQDRGSYYIDSARQKALKKCPTCPVVLYMDAYLNLVRNHQHLRVWEKSVIEDVAKIEVVHLKFGNMSDVEIFEALNSTGKCTITFKGLLNASALYEWQYCHFLGRVIMSGNPNLVSRMISTEGPVDSLVAEAPRAVAERVREDAADPQCIIIGGIAVFVGFGFVVGAIQIVALPLVVGALGVVAAVGAVAAVGVAAAAVGAAAAIGAVGAAAVVGVVGAVNAANAAGAAAAGSAASAAGVASVAGAAAVVGTTAVAVPMGAVAISAMAMGIRVYMLRRVLRDGTAESLMSPPGDSLADTMYTPAMTMDHTECARLQPTRPPTDASYPTGSLMVKAPTDFTKAYYLDYRGDSLFIMTQHYQPQYRGGVPIGTVIVLSCLRYGIVGEAHTALFIEGVTLSLDDLHECVVYTMVTTLAFFAKEDTTDSIVAARVSVSPGPAFVTAIYPDTGDEGPSDEVCEKNINEDLFDCGYLTSRNLKDLNGQCK